MSTKNWNAYALAKYSGVPQPTIHRILSGKHGDPRSRTIKRLADGLGVTEAKLRGMDGAAATDTLLDGPEITGQVPLISWVQASEWTDLVAAYMPSILSNESRLLAPKVGSRTFALRIQNDSMMNPHGSPSIPEGSIVLVDPDSHCNNGDVVIARLENSASATIKQLVVDGNQRYLKPLNPAYPTVSIDRNCQIIGRVIKVEIDL